MFLKMLKKRLGHNDDGIAMVMVIGVGSVLTLLAVAAVAYTTGSINKASDDEDWNGALAAAYAGVEEYQSMLANDPGYIRYGNPLSTHTKYVDPATPTLVSSVVAPPTANPAFGLGTGGPWAKVPGSAKVTGGAANAFYRYEVNNSKYYSQGTVTLRSTGKVGSTTRTIYADLKQTGFVDYVYFTDKETVDPYDDLSPCNRYFYDTPTRPTSGTVTCTDIQFGAADVIHGDVHSNDRIVIECGATFEGPITTGYKPASASTLNYKKVGTCTQPNFAGGVPPVSVTPTGLPATNSEMKKETRTDLPDTVPNPGCLYTGPTSITFTSDGYMQVISPYTRKTQVSGEPATSGTTPAACGTVGTATGSLGSLAGARVKVPTNNLVFVQNVPGTSTDPNYTAATTVMTNGVASTNSAYLSCKGSDAKNVLGYPKTNEVAPAAINSVPSYGCRNGDLFVKGTMSGALTVSAENYVYITDDVQYNDDEKDVLGLVGQNAIYMWSPVKKTGTSTYGCLDGYCDTDRTVEAALLSVAHTITVQNVAISVPYRGILTIKGSMAQKFRGIVRNNSGYNKDYNYDKRFKYMAPPKFLTPASTTYGVSTWIEIKPVFNASGSYR